MYLYSLHNKVSSNQNQLRNISILFFFQIIDKADYKFELKIKETLHIN